MTFAITIFSFWRDLEISQIVQIAVKMQNCARQWWPEYREPLYGEHPFPRMLSQCTHLKFSPCAKIWCLNRCQRYSVQDQSILSHCPYFLFHSDIYCNSTCSEYPPSPLSLIQLIQTVIHVHTDTHVYLYTSMSPEDLSAVLPFQRKVSFIRPTTAGHDSNCWQTQHGWRAEKKTGREI